MCSPAFLQLFSRCINMKQDADLRIEEENMGEWGEKRRGDGGVNWLCFNR